jgi:hypothetical protein
MASLQGVYVSADPQPATSGLCKVEGSRVRVEMVSSLCVSITCDSILFIHDGSFNWYRVRLILASGHSN